MKTTDRSGLDRLRDHARDCAECAAAPLPLDVLSRSLASQESAAEDPMLSRRVMTAASPVLAAHAKRVYRTQFACSLLLTLGPLPLVAFFDAYMLREAYRVLSGWLPGAMVAWMLVGYAGMLLLLCALTYAALPLLIPHPRAEAEG